MTRSCFYSSTAKQQERNTVKKKTDVPRMRP